MHGMNAFMRLAMAGALVLPMTAGICSALGSESKEVRSGAAPRLSPLGAQPLALGAIKPGGWLRTQLEVQAAGLGGRLDEFWPDVADSSWIGGAAEGWERGPYWLDGFIPLAVHLDDAEMRKRAERWIDHILNTQQEDGWLGPVKGNPSQVSRLAQYDVWPRFIVLKAFTQWQEATADPRIVPAMQRFLRRVDQLLDERPLAEWARVRWADLVVSIYWLHDRTREPWLLDLAAKVRKQGLRWPDLARDFPYTNKITEVELREFAQQNAGHFINDQFGATHGVNIAMGVKAPGVWGRQSQDPRDKEAVYRFLDTLDRWHGQANGMFSCDEHVAGRHPSQGSELCAVVELMFSLETLLAVAPDVGLADRLETLAFNALPATFTDTMWAHQYVQQANQAVCKVSPERIYSNNGPEANLFGLEPNFGCCLANLHQGWPKYVSHLWMGTRDGGLMAMSYAPCEVKTRLGRADVRLRVVTDYPFSDQVDILVWTSEPARFPIDLRIPGWAKGATLTVNQGKAKRVEGGRFHRVTERWAGESRVRITLPMPLRVEPRFNQSVSIYRGPVLLSLKVKEEWRKLRERGPTADWEVYPASPWNYALLLDPEAPEETLTVLAQPALERPFWTGYPGVRVVGKGRQIPEWTLIKNAADAPPVGPVPSSEPLEEVELVPYAAAKLRVTEIPILKQD